MNKLPMYIILTVTMGIGSYIPVLFNQSLLGGWSVIGSVVGGIIGVIMYAKLRKSGILE